MTLRPRRGEMRRRSAVPTCPGRRPNTLRQLRTMQLPTLPRSLLVTSYASPLPSHPSVLPHFHDEHVVVHLGVCKRPAARPWWHRPTLRQRRVHVPARGINEGLHLAGERLTWRALRDVRERFQEGVDVLTGRLQAKAHAYHAGQRHA